MAEVKTTEEYDGSSWTSGGTASDTGGEFAALAGLQTDALAVGGYTGAYHANAESYNGTIWATEADPSVNQHAGSAVASGHEDYIFAGGSGDGHDPNGTYHYDGTEWSSGGNLSNDRHVACMNGTTGDAIYSQGSGSRASDSELYDGSTWSSGPTASAGRYSPSNSVACSGSANGVVFAGGTSSANSAGTNGIQHYDE